MPQPPAQPCARPTITAVSSRSRRLRVSRGRSAAERSAVHPIQQRVEQLAPQSPACAPERAAPMPQQILGQIAAVERRQILRAVLQMVQHLQRGAQRVRWRLGVARSSPCRSSTWRPTGTAE